MTKKSNGLAEVAQRLAENGAKPEVIAALNRAAENRASQNQTYLRKMAGWPPERERRGDQEAIEADEGQPEGLQEDGGQATQGGDEDLASQTL